ncbi:MAG TPA: hypothetical protein PK869_05720 [Candidatus Hydrogenedentes bacterium]|nr:hypothetical protein [Candidatus Hydrogenedentota bacterium]
MDEMLANRIKCVYPEGVLWERADDELGANEQLTCPRFISQPE